MLLHSPFFFFLVELFCSLLSLAWIKKFWMLNLSKILYFALLLFQPFPFSVIYLFSQIKLYFLWWALMVRFDSSPCSTMPYYSTRNRWKVKHPILDESCLLHAKPSLQLCSICNQFQLMLPMCIQMLPGQSHRTSCSQKSSVQTINNQKSLTGVWWADPSNTLLWWFY